MFIDSKRGVRSRAWVLLPVAVVLVTCGARPTRAQPARLISVWVEPDGANDDRTARVPSIVLAFDRALAEPEADSAWLLDGGSTTGVANEAARGAMGPASAMRRIAADVLLDTEPTRLRVRARGALLPDREFVLATTSHLLTDEGVPALAGDAGALAFVRAFRVAPARECATRATLAFPTLDRVVPFGRALGVRFDRRVRGDSRAFIVRSQRDEGLALAGVVDWGCGSDAFGYHCAMFRPANEWVLGETYTIDLGAVRDLRSAALTPSRIALAVSDRVPSPQPSFRTPLACGADEVPRPPFCARVVAGAIELRAETTAVAGLRVWSGDRWALGDAGTQHRVRLLDLPPAIPAVVSAALYRPDGTLVRTVTLDSLLTPPATVTVQITEILARPRSASAQEFVEVQNTGTATVQLGGMSIRTVSGACTLAASQLAPGQRGVIVGSSFDPRGVPLEGDPAVAPGAVVVRCAAGSLASRGLSDRGADVWLADARGFTVTRAPTAHPSLEPRVGVSVVRADATFPEDDPAGWAYDALAGASPGSSERLR